MSWCGNWSTDVALKVFFVPRVRTRLMPWVNAPSEWTLGFPR